jgi:hypothetical protein
MRYLKEILLARPVTFIVSYSFIQSHITATVEQTAETHAMDMHTGWTIPQHNVASSVYKENWISEVLD